MQPTVEMPICFILKDTHRSCRDCENFRFSLFGFELVTHQKQYSDKAALGVSLGSGRKYNTVADEAM